MAFLKNKTQGNFVIVSQNIMHDTNLGLTERGLLITLLSLPDGWNLSIAGLTHILPDGKDKIAKALKTLTELGYLTREQGRTGNGKFGSNMLEIHETPVKVVEITDTNSDRNNRNETDLPYPENPSTVNPHTDKPSTENPSQLNNKDTNNNKSNNKELNKQECSTDTLMDDEYKSLVDEFGNDTVDYQINRIKENHYKGCMNYKTIHEWCMERKERKDKNVVPFKKNTINHGFESRDYDWDELEKQFAYGGK